MHNQDGANQEHCERSGARPQQAWNRPPMRRRTSASALVRLLVTFLRDSFAKLMTEEFFVLQWMCTQLAFQKLAKLFRLGFFGFSEQLCQAAKPRIPIIRAR